MAALGRHISSSFEGALTGLRNSVLMMSSLTERLLNRSMQGLLQRDSDLCDLAIADDEEVDFLEKEVDREGAEIRHVISAMRLSVNRERIADQSVLIARRAKKLNKESSVPEISLLEPLFREALGIFHDAMKVFVDGDAEMALQLKPRDRVLDSLNKEVADKFIERIAVDPSRVQSYINLILIARALERVGDHSTNIGEDAFWASHAEDIRHTYEKKTEE